MHDKESGTAGNTYQNNKTGLLAVSPMFFFAALFLGISMLTGDFYKVSLSVVFTISSIYAIFTLKNRSISDRIRIFSSGAGQENLMVMLWIFIMAGAFAQTAKDIGAIDAAVNITLSLLPAHLVLVGLFAASCFVSLSIGTSVGTTAALVPIASGIATNTGEPVALVVAIVVGGAFFGDNLSLISDTTIAATKTQNCELSDKFKANFQIVLPAAIITAILYILSGTQSPYSASITTTDLIKVIPYVAVLITAIAGMNVFAVLLMGNVLAGIIGLTTGCTGIEGWLVSTGKGIMSMGELIIISMLAGGMLEVIKANGGIDYIIGMLSKRINGKRGGELCIGAIVSLTNLCTANNTVAIISVGKIAKEISNKYGINPCKSASILDTFSCVVQGLIPYGAQILMAAGLSGTNPVTIVPYMYYPMIMGVVTIGAILLKFPKKYS